MKQMILSLLVVALLAPMGFADDDVVPAFTPSQAFDVDPVKLPDFKHKNLDNGMQVYYIPDHELPLVNVRIMFPAGKLHNPMDKPGLNNFVADMLLKGTENRSATEIAETIDFVGGSINTGAGNNTMYMNCGVMSRDMELGFELMADALMNPTFPEDEIERLRMQRVSGLMTNVDDPGTIADEQWNKWVYGDHPYSQPTVGTVESVQSFTRDDLVMQHQRLIVPGHAVMLLSGDFEYKDAQKLVNKYFSGWIGNNPPQVLIAGAEADKGREILLIDDPNAVQSEVRMGYILGPYNLGDDMYAFNLMDYIYGGGGFSSRLMKRVRTELGLTYGIYSGLDARVQNAAYSISGSTKNDGTGQFITESLRLMEEAVENGFTQEELRDAKAYMLGSYPRRFETPSQVAGQFQNALILDLGDPDEYIANYRKKMAAVDLDDINEMAKKYLHPDQVRIVVVGNAEVVKPMLDEVGTVTVKSIDEFKTEM
ncbi:insulinase family protein [bacterium]|nr:insulinase family protein [bacterium]